MLCYIYYIIYNILYIIILYMLCYIYYIIYNILYIIYNILYIIYIILYIILYTIYYIVYIISYIIYHIWYIIYHIIYNIIYIYIFLYIIVFYARMYIISCHDIVTAKNAGRSAESSRASTPKCPVWSIVDPGDEGPRWDSQVLGGQSRCDRCCANNGDFTGIYRA